LPLTSRLERYQSLRFRLDPTSDWDEELIAGIAETGSVELLDFKGHYEGSIMEQPPEPEPDLYRRVVAAVDGVDDVWFEDPRLTPEIDKLLAPYRSRITWDANSRSAADIEALPFPPRLLDASDYVEAKGIGGYGGGMYELGPGRGQIQYLASLFHPDAPNDTSPTAFSAPTCPKGCLTGTSANRVPLGRLGWATSARCLAHNKPVRLWFDMTAPAHPLVFRPVLARLREQGHDVVVTARDYAQTLGLLERLGIEHVALGRHGGASRVRKLTALVGRTSRMRRFGGRNGGFDLAIGHGSNDLALAAAQLRIPAVNTFDYEFAVQQHHIGCRLARRVMVPEAIPPDRLERFGVRDGKLARYPGLKEEYYLADFSADEGVLDALDVDRGRFIVVIRPPPDVSLYHRKSNPLFVKVLEELGRREDVHAVVVPRTQAQREQVLARMLPSIIVPSGAIDAQSLIALADLVISAGGTMNREAVALGTPVYTTYGGRLGGVDEWLIRQGRLRPLTDPRAIDLVKRRTGSDVNRRDCGLLVDLILGAA
jgi:predicted glycosyltransferase